MDGISAAASIIALIQITGTVISICYDLRNGQDGPSDANRICAELIDFRNVLERILPLAEGQNISNVRTLTESHGTLTLCHDEVQALHNELKGARTAWKAAKSKILWPLKEKSVTQRLQAIERTKTTLILAIEADQIRQIQNIDDMTRAIAGDVAMLRVSDTQHQFTEIIEWLCPTDYQKHQTDILDPRREGTGRWFFESPVFTQWIRWANEKPQRNTLFCPGHPGTGKSMVAAAIANRLQTIQSKSIRVLQVYCYYKGQAEQTAVHLLGALLRQLIEGLDQIPNPVRALYKKKANATNIPDLQKTLREVAASFSQVYVIVDALDECSEMSGSTNRPRSCLLSTLRLLEEQGNTKVLCTSRYVGEIEELFVDDLCLRISAPDDEIATYVEKRVLDFRVVRGNTLLQNEIVSTIVRIVSGVFLLARLAIDTLQSKPTVKLVRSALTSFPSGSGAFGYAYTDAIDRIRGQPEDFSELAMHALAWVSCAMRPLRSIELRHALAIEPGQPSVDEDGIPDIDVVLSACAGLLVQDKESDTVGLVHLTLQQYLDAEKSQLFPDVESLLAFKCVTYFSNEDLQTTYFKPYPRRLYDTPGTITSADNARRRYPLLSYTACHWADHARKGEAYEPSPNRSLLHAWVLDFRDRSPTLVNCTYSELYYAGIEYWHSMPQTETSNLYHLLAYYGTSKLLSFFLEEDRYAFYMIQDAHSWEPSSYAAARGHRDAVMVLLNHTKKYRTSQDHLKMCVRSFTVASRCNHQTLAADLLTVLEDMGVTLDKTVTNTSWHWMRFTHVLNGRPQAFNATMYSSKQISVQFYQEINK